MADAADVDAARSLIAAADVTQSQALDALFSIRFTAAGTLAAEEVLRAAAPVDRLWAALYVYAGLGRDPELVRPYLASTDATIRGFAAELLASSGDLSGLEALIERLLDDEMITGSEPPAAGWEAAIVALERLTLRSELAPSAAAPTADERTQARERWAAWLARERDRLSFDATGVWRLP